MTRYFGDRNPLLAWWLPVITGIALLACVSVARSTELPHSVKIIHIHPPGYLDFLPDGPFTDADIRDAMALANLGDPEAQANLGVMFQSKGDYEQAVDWYERAAHVGVTTAQYNMGTLYFNGEGVPKDYAKALQWFQKAANRGNAFAQFQLGLMYFTGQGVAKDSEREIYWYRKAAAQGLAPAAYNLGVAYANGEGVPADQVTAYAWLLLAQKFAGNEGRIDTRGALATIGSNLTPAQIRQAEAMSHQLADDPKPLASN